MKTPINGSKSNTSISDYVKSVAWLIEAGFRGFVGYEMLTHFVHNYLVAVVSIYALVTAALIVITHFVKAHR